MSSNPAHLVKQKEIVLVSLPTLSNQDRELYNKEVLSGCECSESRILLFGAVSGDYCSMVTW